MTYWDWGTGHGPITDESVLHAIRYHQSKNIPLTKALIEDDLQKPSGAVWLYMLDMQRRGLVKIENETITCV